MKKLLSVILTVVMLVVPMAETAVLAAPSAVMVADVMEEQPSVVLNEEKREVSFKCSYDEKGNVIEDVSYEKVVSDEKSETTLFSTLPELEAPTGLKWNTSWDGDTAYGWISWDSVENSEGEYVIKAFRDGKEVRSLTWRGLYKGENGRVGVSLIADGIFIESGTYTFAVMAKGDRMNYSDSQWSYSDEYEYVLSQARLGTPKNVVWGEEGVIYHDSVEHVYGRSYLYIIYDQNKKIIGRTYNVNYITDQENNFDYIKKDLSRYIADLTGRNDDLEKIYVTVTALTSNVELYQNSYESEFSPAYEINLKKDTAQSAVENALASRREENLSAQETLDSMLEELENQDISSLDLAVSMQQSESLVSSIQELENIYKSELNIDTQVSDAPEDSEYLESKGIDVSDISVVGAALNSENGQNVNINFSKADSSLSIDEAFYKNSVAVNIEMTGVTDSKKLKVPIQMTMPIPTGVLPERMAILHYLANGSIETIYPTIFTDSGVAYARFVLTSFSPFVFCNIGTLCGDVTGDGEVTRSDLLRLAKHFSGFEVEMDEAAADVTGDGKVTRNDLLRLAKYFSGFDVELGK